MKIKIFCHCSLFPSWSGEQLISTPVLTSLHRFISRKTSNFRLHFFRYISERPIGPFFTDFLDLTDGTDRLSRNVG